MAQTDRTRLLAILFPVYIAVSSLAVILRLWSRRITPGSRYGWDDTWAILSWVLLVAYSSSIIASLPYGLGQHRDTLKWEDFIPGSKLEYSGAILFVAVISAPKFSVLSFYNRVFDRANRPFRIVVWVLAASNAVIWIVFDAYSIFLCNPIERGWNMPTRDVCNSRFTWYLGFGITSCILDVAILIAPLPLIWALKINLRKKLYIMFVFVLGYSVVALTIVRSAMLAAVFDPVTGINRDPAYAVVPLIVTGGAEATVSLLGACLPTIFHLFSQIRRGGLGSVVFKSEFGRDYRQMREQQQSLERQRSSDLESAYKRRKGLFDATESQLSTLSDTS